MNVSGWTSADNNDDSNDPITVNENRSTRPLMPLMLASPPVELYYYQLVFLSAAIALGVPGNLLVITVYAAVPRKIACDWYILYIGGLDLIVCLFRVPTHLAMETGYWQRHSSSGLCRLVYWLSQSVITASVILFGFIAVDRYIKICRTDLQLSLRFSLGCVAVITVSSMLSALPTIWIYSNSAQGQCVTTTLLGEGLTRAYYSFIFVVFILMFLVVVSCYTLIVVKVRRSRKILKAHGVRDLIAQSTVGGKSRAKRRENRVGVVRVGDDGQACGTKRSSLDFDGCRDTPWVTGSSLTSAPQNVQDKELLWPGSDEQTTTDSVHLHSHREPTTGTGMEAQSRKYDLNRPSTNIVGVDGLSRSDQSSASVAGAPPTARGSMEDNKDLTTGTDVVHSITIDNSQTGGRGPTSAEARSHVTRSREDIKRVPCFHVAPASKVSDGPTHSTPSASCVDSKATSGNGRHGHLTKVMASKGGHSSRNLRLTLLLLIMTILFVVSWILPYVAMVWYFYVGYTPPFSASDLSVMTYAPTGYILNHFANPFVYLIFSSSFRKHLVYLWRKLKDVLC